MDDGYPTEEELTRIKEWDYKDFVGLMEFLGELWDYKDFGWKQNDYTYTLSTAGWSGNESLIDALQENSMFWTVCWQSSRRGGHYVFTIPAKALGLKGK